MPVYGNYVVFIVSQSLMWEDEVACDEILKQTPVCLVADEEASLAPWPGMGVHGGHSVTCPVGGKSSLALIDSKIPHLSFSPSTADTSNQHACCPGGHGSTGVHSEVHSFLSGPVGKETSGKKDSISCSLASVHVAKAAWKLLPSTRCCPGSQGSECPCSPSCGSPVRMNEAFPRTRLYE